MAELTQEQYNQLYVDSLYMKQAGMSQEEIDMYLDERTKQLGGPSLPTEKPYGQAGLEGSQKAALFAGPVIGGFYGAQLSAGRNALPFLGGAGRAITQFGGEALGIGVGDVAGRAAAGVPQNLKETAQTAAGGAAVGSLLRGAVQVGGYVGDVPEAVTTGAAEPMRVGRVPVPVPNLQRVARAGPQTVAQVKAGISPEMDLADRASKAARKLTRTITEARREKESIIRLADSRRVRIPVAPIQDSLRQHLITDPAEITKEARQLNARIKATVRDLGNAASTTGGTLSPGQVDRLIRQQLRPRAYTGTGQPSHSMFAGPVADAESSATQLLNDALPGDVAKMNAEIHERLTDLENASKMFGDPDKAGVASRLANAFKPNNETSARALNVLSQHDKKLVDDAYDLYVRRQLAGDIRATPAGGAAGRFGKVISRPIELATRGAAPFQRFAGGTAAGAYEAFYRQFDPMAHP